MNKKPRSSALLIAAYTMIGVGAIGLVIEITPFVSPGPSSNSGNSDSWLILTVPYMWPWLIFNFCILLIPLALVIFGFILRAKAYKKAAPKQVVTQNVVALPKPDSSNPDKNFAKPK
jgi:hypothetical protein